MVAMLAKNMMVVVVVVFVIMLLMQIIMIVIMISMTHMKMPIIGRKESMPTPITTRMMMMRKIVMMMLTMTTPEKNMRMFISIEVKKTSVGEIRMTTTL